ncbi:hypothetical protein BC826DRAFT_1005134 [Russula brevipes]|nr:hypothetical protein BC826DRAFT_1005134 [Russula brevipes]
MMLPTRLVGIRRRWMTAVRVCLLFFAVAKYRERCERRKSGQKEHENPVTLGAQPQMTRLCAWQIPRTSIRSMMLKIWCVEWVSVSNGRVGSAN